MSRPEGRRFFPILTLGLALAMIPLGGIFVVAANYFSSQGWSEGVALPFVAVLAIAGAYMPYAGILLFVLLVVFWLRVFHFERRKREDVQ